MTELTLLDALIILFILFKVSRAGQAALGNTLHSLIALSLLVALFLGLRLSAQMRDVLGGLAGFMETVPGIGSRLLIIIAAWYLMRLLRERLGQFLEKLTPQHLRRPLTYVAEALRATLLAALVLWIVDPWLAPSSPDSSRAVLAVRAGDAWVEGLFDESPASPAHPYPAAR